MLNRIVLIIFALLVVISAVYALRDTRDLTTSSDEALRLYNQATDLHYKLYTREGYHRMLKAVEEDSNFAMANLMLAEWDLAMGRMKQAEMYFDRAKSQYDKLKKHEKLRIDFFEARMRGNPDEMVAIMETYTQQFPDRLEGHMYLGSLAWQRGNVKQAIKHFEAILEIDPEFAPAYNSLGYLEFGNNNFDKALKYLTRYMELLPDQANPHDSRGEILMAVGRYDEALEEFKIANQIEPNFMFVLQHMAQVYMNKGMFSKADLIFKRIERLAQEDYEKANLVTTRAFSYLARGDHEALRAAADTVYRVVALQDSTHAEFWKNLIKGWSYLPVGLSRDTSRLYLAAEHLASADSVFEVITADYADQDLMKRESVNNQRGWLAALRAAIGLERGNSEEALALEDIISKMGNRRPDYEMDLKVLLAEGYYKSGDKQKAYQILDKNLSFNPNHTMSLLVYGILLEKDDRINDAVEKLNRFLLVLKDADEGIPLIEDVRQRKARLSSQASAN